MAIKSLKIRGYELTTPKFGGDIQYENVYDYELIELLLNSILKLDKPKRMYKNETVMISLGDLRQSEDAAIVEGYFVTARHGRKQVSIDIDTGEEVATIEKHHGVENSVHFTICRNTGLLLVQEDFNKVFSRKLLHTFLHSHKNIIHPYIDYFNRINKANNLIIHRRSCYRLLTLQPIDFFESLRDFRTVKSAILTLDSTTRKKNIDVSQVLDTELENNGIGEYELEIKIKNKTGRNLVNVFERYFEALIIQQKYDSYAIEGILNNGKSKKITPDTITREFFVDVEYNINGIPSMSDVLNGMIRIIKQQNPINEYKGSTPNAIMVGEDESVQSAIQKEIEVRNQDTSSQEEIS